MKTLVTGANGHIGSNVVRALLDEGREVRGMVRKSSDLRALEGLDVELVYGDIRDAEAVKKAVQGCNVVYHLAAVYATWRAEARAIMEPAVQGTENLFGALNKKSVDRVVYTSSVAAVGFTDDPRIMPTEDSWNENQLSNPYMRAKTESERLAHKMAEEIGLPVVYTMPAMVVGALDYKPTPSNLIIVSFLKWRFFMPMRGGTNIVDVRDAAACHLLAEKKGEPGQRYYAVGDNLYWDDLYAILGEVTHRWTPKGIRIPGWMAKMGATVAEPAFKAAKLEPPFTREMVDEMFGVFNFYDDTMTRRQLGYNPRPAREALAGAVDWFRKIGMDSPWKPVKIF